MTGAVGPMTTATNGFAPVGAPGRRVSRWQHADLLLGLPRRPAAATACRARSPRPVPRASLWTLTGAGLVDDSAIPEGVGAAVKPDGTPAFAYAYSFVVGLPHRPRFESVGPRPDPRQQVLRLPPERRVRGQRQRVRRLVLERRGRGRHVRPAGHALRSAPTTRARVVDRGEGRRSVATHSVVARSGGGVYVATAAVTPRARGWCGRSGRRRHRDR